MVSIFKKNRFGPMTPYLLITPVAVYYLIFWLLPVLGAVWGSFRDEFGQCTLTNYGIIFQDPVFYKALINTGFIVSVSVCLEFLIAFAMALLINIRFRGSSAFLFIAIIPMALPSVAVGAMWNSGFATRGWLNSIMITLGVIAESQKFLFLAGNELQSMILIILIDAWQVIPFMMVILLAGLQALDKETREAGYIFGASRLQVLRIITIPMLKPTITTAVILRIISALQIWLIIVMIFGFNRIPVLLEQVVLNVDQLGSPYFYRLGMALSVIVAVIVSLVAILYLKLSGSLQSDPIHSSVNEN